MKSPCPSLFLLLTSVLLVSTASAAETEWRSLFDGSLSGWRQWLGYPHTSYNVPDLPRDANTGGYAHPIGWDSDPLVVFRVAEVDGTPVIHVSGQVFGLLTTRDVFANYHLRLQFKWGERRWAPRAEAPRDSGLLYHVHGEMGRIGRAWPASVEMQIQERDVGDLFALLTQATARAQRIPVENGGALHVFDPTATPVVFGQGGTGGVRCVKLRDYEKPHGEWNTIELVTLGQESMHIVNGEVVMRLSNIHAITALGSAAPLAAGRIGLQSEGAEIFFRNIEIRSISAIPPEFAVR